MLWYDVLLISLTPCMWCWLCCSCPPDALRSAIDDWKKHVCDAEDNINRTQVRAAPPPVTRSILINPLCIHVSVLAFRWSLRLRWIRWRAAPDCVRCLISAFPAFPASPLYRWELPLTLWGHVKVKGRRLLISVCVPQAMLPQPSGSQFHGPYVSLPPGTQHPPQTDFLKRQWAVDPRRSTSPCTTGSWSDSTWCSLITTGAAPTAHGDSRESAAADYSSILPFNMFCVNIC